jgi:hypothetical protein
MLQDVQRKLLVRSSGNSYVEGMLSWQQTIDDSSRSTSSQALLDMVDPFSHSLNSRRAANSVIPLPAQQGDRDGDFMHSL